MGIGVRFDALLDFSNAPSFVQVHTGEAERSVHKVDMGVHKPGKYQPASGIDHLRTGSPIFQDFLSLADGEDLSIFDCDGLGPRHALVDCVNPTVGYDYVGDLLRLSSSRNRDGQK